MNIKWKEEDLWYKETVIWFSSCAIGAGSGDITNEGYRDAPAYMGDWGG